MSDSRDTHDRADNRRRRDSRDAILAIELPELSLVVLVGASGSGKSMFARKHFMPTEIVSSDQCRALVSDDENDQSATDDAFRLLHTIAAKRMARGRLTVIDATNVQQEARKPLIKLAREHHFLPVAIVLDMPEKLAHERNQSRPDRQFGPHVVRNQTRDLRRSLRGLQREGFRSVHVLNTPEDVDAATITRTPLWNNKKTEHGPFDVIGDVHGCCSELEELLAELGYTVVDDREERPLGGRVHAHPEGRKAVFVGDLVDRGPRILDTVALVRNMVEHGSAFCVPGNHDQKLVRKLRGRDVQITHGLDRTLAELDAVPEDERKAASAEAMRFLDGLVSHYVFDDGKLVVAHAGMKRGNAGPRLRQGPRLRAVRRDDRRDGRVRPARALELGSGVSRPGDVVYGHTPVPRARMAQPDDQHRHRLRIRRPPHSTALSGEGARERARGRRSTPSRSKPFLPVEELPETCRPQQQREDELLDIEDVLGKRIIPTRLARTVTIREENAIAALEVMSRFAANPKWLIYLPPTMSPSETSGGAGAARAPARSVRLLPPARRAEGDLRGEAHGLTRGRDRLS